MQQANTAQEDARSRIGYLVFAGVEAAAFEAIALKLVSHDLQWLFVGGVFAGWLMILTGALSALFSLISLGGIFFTADHMTLLTGPGTEGFEQTGMEDPLAVFGSYYLAFQVAFGWLLGLIVTLADLVRPTE